MKKTLKAAIYGFAIGDAVGVPYEFEKRNTFCCKDMRGGGTWRQPAGTWSDDTSLTLATCDSIRKRHKISYEDLMNKFSGWLLCARYTARNEVFDCGYTTRIAIENYMRGYPIERCGCDEFYNNGNGALMRILPLAFIDCTSDEVRNVSALTHAHDISIKTCIEYVNLTRKLIEDRNTKMMLEDAYKHIPADYIKSTGFVIDTFEAAKWALANSTSYKDCILKAVNLGGDTDTIAAIAGGWAGIVYGYKNIPLKWRMRLKNKKLINSCINWEVQDETN